MADSSSTEDTMKASHLAVNEHSVSGGSTRAASPSPSLLRPGHPRTTSTAIVNGYFVGPRDLEKHSKLPYFMRMSGSVTPRMIVPLLVAAGWSTCITCISRFVYPLEVDTVLLTVLGIVIGLAISFRTSSAYERYIEGRKYWSLLSQASRDLSRHIWIHAQERHAENPELGKQDLLAKITAMNLITAFAVALRHKLQFEPYANYPDLEHLIGHLDTFAHQAYDPTLAVETRKKTWWKTCGEYLGLDIAESNPRKQLKRATKRGKNLGNLPLEILTYLSGYIESLERNGTLNAGPIQAMIIGSIQQLNEVMTGTERVLNTPLPVAYSIAISQITWVYVLMLPFQLYKTLGWLTIPGTIVGAYIILGIAAIGREIENPFGNDTNDLPMDSFCKQIASEIDIMMSKPQIKPEDFITKESNLLLFSRSHNAWNTKTVDEIRRNLKAKANSSSVQVAVGTEKIAGIV